MQTRHAMRDILGIRRIDLRDADRSQSTGFLPRCCKDRDKVLWQIVCTTQILTWRTEEPEEYTQYIIGNRACTACYVCAVRAQRVAST